MARYADSAVSSTMYREVESIVREIVDNPEKYPTRKSVMPKIRELREIREAMLHHRAYDVIDELEEEIKMYCKRGGCKTCGTAFIFRTLYTLQDMQAHDRSAPDDIDQSTEKA